MRHRLFGLTLAVLSIPFACAFVVVVVGDGVAQNVLVGLESVIPHAAVGADDQPASPRKVVRFFAERGPFSMPPDMRAPGPVRGTVVIVPLGEVSDKHIVLAREALKWTYGFDDVRVAKRSDVPSFAYHPLRRRYRSDLLVDMLLRERPPDTTRLLGITDVRLYSDLTHDVLGMAYLGKPAAIISLNHLRRDVPSQRPRPDANEARRGLYKLLVHEVGHTFGLAHCRGSEPCAMHGGARVAANGPMWSSSYCDRCMTRFRRSWTRLKTPPLGSPI